MVAWLKDFYYKQRAKRELHKLSDKELRDLGINRCDIDRVVDIEHEQNKRKRK